MYKKSLLTPMILLAAVFYPGIQPGSASGLFGNNVRVTNFLSGEEGDQVREEFHQTYPISPNGRLSLENLNGEVRIKVWDRNEIQVDATKHANQRERLNEAKIEVSAGPDAVRIKTRYPDFDQTFSDDERGRHNNPAAVDYSILVPRKARLESIDLTNGSLDVDGVEGDVKAASVNGRVKANGLMGEARLSTVNGAVEAVFTRLDESKAISLGSVNGGVVLIIPSDSNAVVRASTVSGGISNDFGLEVQHGEYVGHELYGQLGTGGSRIRLGNVNGQIVIKHAQDGRKLSSATGLLTEKNKDKAKDKAKVRADRNRQSNDEESQQEVVNGTDVARIASEAQHEVEQATREAQREVEQAMRDAERELQRAQVEIQRQTRRQVRNRGDGAGAGAGKGKGEGSGDKRFTQRESKTFTVAGTPRVNIATFDGAITVHGWDKSEVMYSATKRADDEQQAERITIQAEQEGSVVSIIAKSEEGNGSAYLDVFVPRNTTLHVSSGDGRLTLQGVGGEVTLRTGDGTIEVTDGRGQLQVNTGDGRIQVINFEGQVDARTGDGPITLDGKFSGLAARTGDGSISLSVPTDSHFTIETNVDELSNEGLIISEDISPSKRVKRWKVGRGGNVFVLSTSDGKVVIRPR